MLRLLVFVIISVAVATVCFGQSIHDPEIFRLPRSSIQEAEPFPVPRSPTVIYRSGSTWRDRELERQKLQEMRFQSQMMQDRFRAEALRDANRAAEEWAYVNRLLEHHEEEKEQEPERWALMFPPPDDMNAPMGEWSVYDVYQTRDRCRGAREVTHDIVAAYDVDPGFRLECWPEAEIVRYRRAE